MEFEVVPAKNGQAALRAIREDGSILTVNSIYNPEREAASWAEDVDLSAHSMVLFGLGLGYHARELLRGSRSLSHLFIVEPFAELPKLARTHNHMDDVLDDPRVHLVSDWQEFAARYREEVDRWKKIRLLKIPVYGALCQDRYEGFLDKFRRELNSLMVDRRTVINSALRWQENALRNLSYLPESVPVSSVFGSMQGKPAIIVSAGPSLDRNLHLLKQAQNRAMIVAVGTVARLLHSNGIQPSVVMSFDGWEANYKHHFRNLELSNTPLIYDLAVHYKVVSEYRGPRVLMLVNPANYWVEEVMDCEIGRIEMGPSIANTAFDFCLKLGANPIIFVGQDLAYTDRRRHASFTHDPDADGYEYEVPEEWLASKTSEAVEIKAGSEKQANYWR
ncbi:MAG TPA: 6-hydroxymethylpterin diphosphokinase MptE-like protein, partial [Acidobacteriota bacterium]|nr:6-hydroxymethylpterin diphosphokinase MptE-like protein [Acidobacteriota bacterium]